MIHANSIASRITLATVGLGAVCALAISPASARSQATTPARSAAADANTGAGASFPAVTSRETVAVRFSGAKSSGPPARQAFVDQVNLIGTSAERPITIIAQAVGDERRTPVLMNIEPHQFLTSYVARAILARMSSLTRLLREITKQWLSADFDIFTLASIVGFDRIVVTDGRKFSREVLLVPAAS